MPTASVSSLIAVRIDGSSSITNTTCSAFFMVPSSCLVAGKLHCSSSIPLGVPESRPYGPQSYFSEGSAFQRRTNTTEQTLISKWFSQELYRACFECLHSHSRISVGRDEDDRYPASFR